MCKRCKNISLWKRFSGRSQDISLWNIFWIVLQPQISGANISPFSSKNLPKRKESVLSSNQIEVYKSVIDKIPKDDKLVINQLNRLFLNNYVTKKLKFSSDEISADIKKEQLKIRDYIYYKGFEKEYLDFLQKEISSRYECEN